MTAIVRVSELWCEGFVTEDGKFSASPSRPAKPAYNAAKMLKQLTKYNISIYYYRLLYVCIRN